MFVRSCWKPRSEEELWKFIDSYGWAILINNGDGGPYATNLPLILDRSKARPVLVGHIAEGNEHTVALRSANAPTLAVFQGPWSYVTPSWYPNRDMPSTYYYTSVHCYGRVRIQAEEALRRSLEVLTERMEAQFTAGWKTSEIPPYDITRRLKHIIGFELDIERIEGKFKLGQDEPIKDAMAVGHRLAESPDNNQRELSRLVFEYNKDRVE
jgi:transcriptional regulator